MIAVDMISCYYQINQIGSDMVGSVTGDTLSAVCLRCFA